jgi:hypothetical protein
VVSSSKWVGVVCHLSAAYISDRPTTSVSITAYVTFATEFFTRLFTRKPLRQALQFSDIELVVGADPQGSYSTSTASPKLADGAQVSGRMKLMIIGLAISTLLIFIRYVQFPTAPRNRAS